MVVCARADTPEPPTAPQRSLYAQAFGAIDADAFDRARKLTQRVRDPLARKALIWYRLIEQRTGGDFSAYRTFVESNPDWPWRLTLRHRAEGVMPSDLPVRRILDFFGSHAPQSPYGAERYADALRSVGRTAQARELLRRTWVTGNFPYGDETRFHRRYDDVLSEKLHRQRLERLIWDGRYQAAERQLERIASPGYRQLARARIRLARMKPGVDRAIAAVPDHLKNNPGLIYERARWRMRKGRYGDTAELVDPPVAGYPHPRKWWHIRHWVAREALANQDIERAYRIAANHEMESGLGFAQAEWLAGWIALQFMDEPHTALGHFQTLYNGTTTPVSRARGAFWSGRAAMRTGSPDRGRRWFETAATKLTTFYGQLASARLEDDMFLALPKRPTPTAAERAEFSDRELVRVVRAMADLGRADRVDPFVDDLTDDVDGRVEGRMVADLAESIGRPDLAVAVARDLRRKGMILPRHLYPEREMAVGGSPRVGVDQSLLLAIARQESSFDVHAVSPAGAYGLMQLMPATARHMAAELDMPFSRDRLLNDGQYNLRLGSAYLSKLVTEYDGSLLLGVAAYNAGPTRVDRWLEQYGDPRTDAIGPVNWTEHIPISETRNYVQRVFESYMIYRHRVAPTRVALALEGKQLVAPQATAKTDQNRASCCL
jgi:soluble lytic murein transglycosylase